MELEIQNSSSCCGVMSMTDEPISPCLLDSISLALAWPVLTSFVLNVFEKVFAACSGFLLLHISVVMGTNLLFKWKLIE